MVVKITQLTVYSVIAALAFCFAFLTVIDLAMHLSSQKVFRHQPGTDDAHGYEVLVDCLLVLLFIVQHSLMACTWFKQLIFNRGLIVVERAIYVISTCLVLRVLMANWKPMAGYALWEINTADSSVLWLFFLLLHAAAWIIIYGAALTMDLPEMLGVKQVYYYSMGQDLPITLKSRGAQKLYKHMRHPGTSCFLVILWVHPMMTFSRALLAAFLTLYLMLGHNVKEKDYYYLKEQLMRKQMRLVRMEVLE